MYDQEERPRDVHFQGITGEYTPDADWQDDGHAGGEKVGREADGRN